MKLMRPLPQNRSLEQISKHYHVEKAIANKLKCANRDERKLIYATMYDDLFSQVPDHERLTQRKDESATLMANKSKFALVRSFLDKSTVFAEFAPGDCSFSMEIAKYVRFVYGMDISDQRSNSSTSPSNFKLIIYDGYSLNQIKAASIDVVFSDQLVEHFHPEDTKLHFEMVKHILRKGGRYVFRTPHASSGPHDVSKYFSDEPEGFHLKEWTYTELNHMLTDLNFQFYAFWYAKGLKLRMPFVYFETCEKLLNIIPRRYRRILSRYLMTTNCCCVAVKL